MADDSLDILIKITSDTAGAKEAARELESLGEQARRNADGLREQAEVEKKAEGRGGMISEEGGGQGMKKIHSPEGAGDESKATEAERVVDGFRNQIPSPQPSPRSGGARETDAEGGGGGSRTRNPSPRPSPRSGGERETAAETLRENEEDVRQSNGQLQEIVAALAGQRASLQQATALIGSAARDIGSFTQGVIRLADAMSALARNAGEANLRIDALEAQVRAIHNP